MIEGQLNLLDRMQKTEEEKLVETVLLRGSGFRDGKKRIIEIYNKDMSKAERIEALSKEYGTGGSAVEGISTHHDSKGKKIQLRDLEAEEPILKIDVSLTWAEVDEEIERLIREGRYSLGDLEHERIS